jgi:hypothetical protein
MSEENVEIARRAAEAYNRRDIDRFFAEFATPDLEWWPALTRALEGDCYQGRAGIERFLAETAETWENSKRSLRSSAISATWCLCLEGSKDAGRAAAHPSIRQP